jgi:hypothetical protein
MKITIKDKDIELKNTLRSMIMYENITEKSFNPETVTDIITYMYCVVVASSNDYTLTFDEFINYVDENPTIFDEFGE